MQLSMPLLRNRGCDIALPVGCKSQAKALTGVWNPVTGRALEPETIRRPLRRKEIGIASMSDSPPEAGKRGDVPSLPENRADRDQPAPITKATDPPAVTHEARTSRPQAASPPNETLAADKVEMRPSSTDQAAGAKPTVIVRYGLMRHLGQFRHSLNSEPLPGTELVVRTDRGVELGEVVANVGEATHFGIVAKQELEGYLRANGEDFPFCREGKVLRKANQQDVIDQKHLRSSAKDEAAFCRKQIDELNLEMKLISVEHLLGGERIIFSFSAENRVDFRELVRRLAREYRTRIEMRQVGARDEARLLADYERCGQRCCCQQFIKDLKPVSMRMAKVQKATLDPSKISGRCGRLMCCLRFEDETYEDLRRKLPKKNTWVRTDQLYGKVLDTQILTQLVRVELHDRTNTVIANEQIVERDLPEPTDQDLAALAAQAKAARQLAAQQEVAPRSAPGTIRGEGKDGQRPSPKETTDGQQDKQTNKTKKKRRRRRRRPGRKTNQPSAQTGQKQKDSGAPASGTGQTQQASKPKAKRRRRRRKK